MPFLINLCQIFSIIRLTEEEIGKHQGLNEVSDWENEVIQDYIGQLLRRGVKHRGH
jgi:hypothetical protein